MSPLASILGADSGLATLTGQEVMFRLLLAFVLGVSTAWVYMFTHVGLSYSRTFVQSIVLLTMIVSLAMMVIGNNIIVAFGLIGALAVIRFRNILKDTRDTALIFLSLVVGMASGTGRAELALLGTVVCCLVLILLKWCRFGSLSRGDGLVRFHLEPDGRVSESLDRVLERHCWSSELVSQRFHEDGAAEVAYRLDLKEPTRSSQLLEELRSLDALSQVSLVYQEGQAEL